MIYAVIAACEIGFWVFLVAGLVCRYLLRRQRLSTVLLICVPLVDVVLLAATVIDLRAGATADFAHALAAVYIGFSVAFGHSMVRWADQRFAYRFTDGPAPWKPPKHGMARVRYEAKEYGKALIAGAISCGILFGLMALVGDPERTAALGAGVQLMGQVLAIWLLIAIGVSIAAVTGKSRSDGSSRRGDDGVDADARTGRATYED